MKKYISILILCLVFSACKTQNKNPKTEAESVSKVAGDTVQTAIGPLFLPPPYSTESVTKTRNLKNKPANWLPTAPNGFTVSKFADGFKRPRWAYVAPNGDIFVSEAAADRITLLRDANGDGNIELREIFLDNLNQPFGMLIVGNSFYVANTDGLLKYPYKEGQTSLKGISGTKILNLPAGGYNNHWTRNIITNKNKDKIYISVGSSSNNAEHGMDEEIRRANILTIDLNGKNEKVFASGLRNPVGMDWNPATGELWTAVNERDQLGDDLVPDYITSVKEGGFYGWPFSYFGQIPDPRMKGQNPELVARALIPDVPIKSHSAALGLVFYDKNQFPTPYQNGAFIGLHGSWNRSVISGYKVVFVPFVNGKPTAEPRDFLTGFIADKEDADVYGRPVGVAVTSAGDLLVVDDAGNAIWKVTYSK